MRCAALLLCLLPAFAADRSFDLPCAPSDFAPSGDGSTIWFLCPANPGGTAAYALDIRSTRTVKLTAATFRISFSAAPAGDLAIIRFPRPHQHDLPVLYQRDRRLADLAFDPTLMRWSPDAQLIYFRYGSTTHQEAWDLLGILRFPERTVVNRKLTAPTENFYLCAANNRLYTGTPSKTAVEYDSNGQFLQRWKTFPAGDFSAACRYLATEASFHGPTPWDIIEVSTGRRLFHFEFTDDTLQSSQYEFSAWNPQREGILLRNFYPPSGPIVEVFDVPNGRVLATLPLTDSPARWSGDGRSVVYAHLTTLVIHPVFGDNER